MKIGQLIDDWLKSNGYDWFETLIIYHDQMQQPKIIVTKAEDYRESIFSEHIDLINAVEQKKKELKNLQSKINQAKNDKRTIESSIKKLLKYKEVE